MKPVLLLAHPMEIENFSSWCNSHKIIGLITGVGILSAAASLGKFLAKFPEHKNFLHLGTAGISSQEKHTSEKLLQIATSREYFLNEEESQEYPNTMIKRWEFKALPITNGLVEVSVFSRLGISTRNLNTKGWENMEALGFAEVARIHGVTLNSVLVASNFVNPEGRKKWKENFKQAGDILHHFLNSSF